MSHLPGDLLGGVIDFLGSIESADAETDAAVGQIVRNAQSPQNVTRLDAGRGARRARADGDILERHQQRFAVNAGEADVEVARQALDGMAVDENLVQLLVEMLPEALPKLQRAGSVAGHFLLSNRTGRAKADDQGHRQSAAAHAAFVAATVK